MFTKHFCFQRAFTASVYVLLTTDLQQADLIAAPFYNGQLSRHSASHQGVEVGHLLKGVRNKGKPSGHSEWRPDHTEPNSSESEPTE